MCVYTYVYIYIYNKHHERSYGSFEEKTGVNNKKKANKTVDEPHLRDSKA